jgi:hypothetical protein
MDLVDRIETTRFLGAEFLLWLWFAQDVTSGKLEAGELGLVEVSLESKLSLTDLLSPHETISMKGSDPFGSAEADQALKSGKLPSKALLRIQQGESEWLLSLDAFKLSLSGIKLPGYEATEDEQLFERMSLIEQVDDILHALYREFLNVRLSDGWQQQLFPALQAWVKGNLTLDQRAWTRLHRSATKRSKRR